MVDIKLKNKILKEFEKVKYEVDKIMLIYSRNYRRKGKYDKINKKIEEVNKKLKYFELEARHVGISNRLKRWFGWRNSKKGIVQYCARSYNGYVYSIIVKAKNEEVNKYRRFIKRELGFDKIFNLIEEIQLHRDGILWWLEKEKMDTKKIKKFLKEELVEGKDVLDILEKVYGEEVKERFISKFRKDWGVREEDFYLY